MATPLEEALAKLTAALTKQSEDALRREQMAQAAAQKQQANLAQREKDRQAAAPDPAGAFNQSLGRQFMASLSTGGMSAAFNPLRLLGASAQAFNAQADAAKKKGLDALEKSSRQTAEALDDMAGIAGGLGGVITGTIRSYLAVWETMRGLSAMASPSAEKTLQGSIDMFNAAIGQQFVPAIYMAASGLQGLARVIRSIPSGALTAFVANRVAFLPGGNAFGKMMKELNDQMLKDMVLPMQSRFTTGVDFADALQRAALEADTSKTQTDLLKQQLKQLSDSKQLLTELRDTAKEAAQAAGPWR